MGKELFCLTYVATTMTYSDDAVDFVLYYSTVVARSHVEFSQQLQPCAHHRHRHWMNSHTALLASTQALSFLQPARDPTQTFTLHQTHHFQQHFENLLANYSL